MSLARVNTVQKSRKPGRCEKCLTVLPVGSAYRWYTVGFRSKYRHVRCMKPTCTPRPSERESSAVSEIYAAQEGFEDSVANIDPAADDALETLQSEWETFTEYVREFADMRRMALDQWEYGNAQLEELADEAEEWADAMEGIEVEEFGDEGPVREDYADDVDGAAEFDTAVEEYEQNLRAHFAAQVEALTGTVGF